MFSRESTPARILNEKTTSNTTGTRLAMSDLCSCICFMGSTTQHGRHACIGTLFSDPHD